MIQIRQTGAVKNPVKIYTKDVFSITAISKEEMNLLIHEGIINNSSRGFIDKQGNLVSYYRTVNKRYIGDKYAAIAKKLNQ